MSPCLYVPIIYQKNHLIHCVYFSFNWQRLPWYWNVSTFYLLMVLISGNLTQLLPPTSTCLHYGQCTSIVDESQCWLKAPVFIFYLSKLQGYLQTWVRNVSHSSPLCNLFFINFSRGGSEVIKRNWPSISGNEAHHSQDTRVLNSDSSRKNTRRNEIHSSQNRLLAATSTGVQWEGI